MNWQTTILGIVTLLTLCAAIFVQMMDMPASACLASWGLALAFALAWLFLNRAPVTGFLTRKSTRYGANMALVLFLILGILVFVNVLAKQHSWRKDFTRSGANTLSEQSQKVLHGLPQGVKAYFFANVNEKEKGEDVLKRYAYLSKHFQYEFVDVDRNPTRAQAMGVKRKNTVILALGDTAKRVAVDQPTEEMLTNGLIKLLRSTEVAVYFTSGHDEHALAGDADPLGYSQLRAELEKQGYSVKELNLFSEGKIPADAAVVVVGGPKKAFFPKELDILAGWMRDGGHAVIAVDLDVAESGLAKGSRQVADLLKIYGVRVMSQMLVDPTSKMANVEPQVLLGFAGSREHVITKDFAHSAMAANFLFPLTTYLTHDDNPPTLITSLVNTTPKAWAESDWASLKLGRAVFDPASDHQGQMDLAYAVEAKHEEGKPKPARTGKLVVFANALFADNSLVDKVGNRDLMMNSIAWLADEDRFVSIRAKEDPDSLRQFNNNVVNVVLLLVMVVIPLFLVALGTWVWWRRSKL